MIEFAVELLLVYVLSFQGIFKVGTEWFKKRKIEDVFKKGYVPKLSSILILVAVILVIVQLSHG